MHLILFGIAIILLSVMIRRDLKKLDIAWHRQSLFLLIVSAFFAIAGTLLNYWWMWYTQCPLFLHWIWDAVSSVVMTAILFAIALGGIIFFVKRQLQFRKILAVSEKCTNPDLLSQVEDYARRMLLGFVPDLYIGRLKRHFGATFSVFKPVILLSTYTIEHLDPEELQALLIHELAHIKQKDLLSNACASLIRDFLWFVPNVSRLFQAFHFSLEAQADRTTAIITKKPGALASALLKFESSAPAGASNKDFLYLLSPLAHYPVSTLGFFLAEEDISLQRRLEYLLEDRYFAVKEHFIAPWKLNTVIFTVLWLLLLWFFPYCHFFFSIHLFPH